jgi:enterochelin esterase family protein
LQYIKSLRFGAANVASFLNEVLPSQNLQILHQFFHSTTEECSMKTKLTFNCTIVLVALSVLVAFAQDNKVVTTPATEYEINKLKTIEFLRRTSTDRQQLHSSTYVFSHQDTLHAEGFDAGAPGWKFQDLWSESFWHVSTTGAYSGKSYWCGIEELGGYDDMWLQTLTSPAIDLSGTTSPTLTFMHNYSLEGPGIFGSYNAADGVNVRLSTDGATFDIIQPVGGYPYSSAYGFHLYYGTNVGAWAGKSNGYVKATFDLSAYAGKKIWIRLEFGSDEGIAHEDDPSLWGWRVDDIEISNGGTRVFFDDAGDTGAARFTAGGPGGPNLWHVTSNAAASAPNSAGCFDPATGNYRPRMKAGLISPAIAIKPLSPDTQELIANFQIQGMLDPTFSAGGGLNFDILFVEARRYSSGVWSYWRLINYTNILTNSFAGFNETFGLLSANAFIDADSVQFRIFVLTQPDGNVVSRANVFVDDFTLVAAGVDSIIGPRFSVFYSRVTAAANPLRQAMTDSFMATISSFPFVEGKTTAYFLYRGNANSVTVPGDANGWITDAFPMTRISGTNLWFRQAVFEPDARLDYKFFLNGSTYALDALNPRQVNSGFGPNSELAMPDYAQPPEIEFYPNIPHGTLRDISISSRFLGNSRTIRIYTPPAYATALNDSFPVVLFHDGLDYVTLGKANNVLDYLIAEKRIQPVIAVFVPPVNRNDEYAFNLTSQFESFIVNELVPTIDAQYRTKRDPASRAMLGFSFGGLITTQICYNRPESFGLCAPFSPSYWAKGMEVFNRVVSGPKKAVKFYLDWGTYEGIIMLDGRAMRDNLMTLGYPLQWQEWHEAHSFGSWRAHIDNALEYFFPPNAVIAKNHDLKVTSFPEHLQRVPILANVAPTTTIMNAGLNDESNLSINCRIDSAGVKVYSDVQTIAQLRSLEAKEVTFKNWRTYDAKNYKISFYPTKLANEENVLNDTLRTTVAVSNLVDDFEAGFGKWSSSTGWGLTKERFHSGQFSMDDSPGASYGNNVNSAVTCNFSFDLSKQNAAHLSYWTFNYIRPNDFGYVDVSTDSGKSWKQLGASYSGIRTWAQDFRSLTPYCGPGFKDVRVRFRLVTDSSLVTFGWNLDDIEIHAGDIQTAVTENAVESLPTEYALYSNYPNPFNPQTFIEYQLPQAGQVKLVVFNLSGQVIRTLVDAPQQPGRFKLRWDGRDDLGNGVASGVYLYQLQAGNFSQTKKMILLR